VPKEKESSKREKLKERENDNVFVQPSTVQRSPRSLGELFRFLLFSRFYYIVLFVILLDLKMMMLGSRGKANYF
jgi:hypothetical protein